MKNSLTLENAARHTKVISRIIGYIYSAVSAVVLLALLIQTIMNQIYDSSKGFNVQFLLVQISLFIAFSIAIIVGLSYIKFARNFREAYPDLIEKHNTLRILSLLIPVILTVPLFTLLFSFIKDFSFAPPLFEFFALVYFISLWAILIAAFTVPQFIIHKKVKKYMEANLEQAAQLNENESGTIN